MSSATAFASRIESKDKIIAYDIHRHSIHPNGASEIIYHAVHRNLGAEICRVDVIDISEA